MKYQSSLAFVDLLFNLLLSFVCLFVLSFILISPKSDSGKIDVNAEFLVTLSWSNEYNDDLDLWVEDPEGRKVFFGAKEQGLMHLDRDDRGTSSDVIETSEGKVTFEYNQEVVTIRGIVPGEYVVNVHSFNLVNPNDFQATVQILKLNPYGIVCDKTLDISSMGKEHTICRFTVDLNGDVIETNEIPKKLMVVE